MENLLEETLEVLKENGKTPDDIEYITNWEVYNTWEYFAANSDILYDNGYGGEEIDLSLEIVWKDFWLERQEYDGAESRSYKCLTVKPREQGEIIIKIPPYNFDDSNMFG